MKFTWLTDVHLDFAEKDVKERFYADLKALDDDFVVISGDIANGPERTCSELVDLQSAIEKSVYFVGGNHDFYGESLAKARRLFNNPFMEPRWLGAGDMVHYDGSVVCGTEGWYDGRFGDFHKSNVWLTDYDVIKDFEGIKFSKELTLKKIQEIADIEAGRAESYVRSALNLGAKTIVFVTHVPPWREASTYKGKISDDNWAPHFVSRVMGETLEWVMEDREEKLVVLCGHTHGAATIRVKDNITCHTGEAAYGKPRIGASFNF